MTVLHEPFCNLRDYGETDARARTFDSPLSLLAWLRDETHGMSVFLKETPVGAHGEFLTCQCQYSPRRQGAGSWPSWPDAARPRLAPRWSPAH